jgi:ABC-type multidrug transport system ATPase subunit
VIVEHDMPLLMGLCDRVYALVEGRVVAEGTPEEIRRDPEVIASYLGTDETAIARSGGVADRPARPGRNGRQPRVNGKPAARRKAASTRTGGVDRNDRSGSLTSVPADQAVGQVVLKGDM